MNSSLITAAGPAITAAVIAAVYVPLYDESFYNWLIDQTGMDAQKHYKRKLSVRLADDSVRNFVF